MYDSNHTYLSDMNGYTITAISLYGDQVMVKLERTSRTVCLIGINAAICYASIDYVSILRLSAEDRRIARVHTLRLDQETFLLVVLTCGIYLTICAESIALQ